MKRYISSVSLIISMVSALCLVFGAGCSGEASGDPRPEPTKRSNSEPRLSFVKAETFQYRRSWDVRGVIEPSRTAGASFLLGGRLIKVLVKRGDRVERGQVLARLDTSEVGAGIAQARSSVAAADSQVKLAEDALTRLEPLEKQGVISESQVVKVRLQREGAQALRDQARAALRMARVKSGQHMLKSPIAGTVLSIPDEIGEIVGPGIPLFEIASLDLLRFKGTLPSEAAGLIRSGQTAKITRRNGQVLEGRLTYVSPALTADTHRLPFEVEIEPDESMASSGLANSYVTITIEATEETTVARIPTTALVRAEDIRVFVVNNENIIKGVEVSIIANEGDDSLIDGISPGTTLVNLPPVDLSDGTRVRP